MARTKKRVRPATVRREPLSIRYVYESSSHPHPDPAMLVRYMPREGSQAYAFNGEFSINRYRCEVRVDLVEEDVEALRDRLRKLWRENEFNHHHSDAFSAAASELGITLDWDERGTDHKRRS